jgi:hypothetical protein
VRRAAPLLLAAALGLAAAGPGCKADEARTPEGAVRRFAQAADPRSRERDRVFELVGPRTRARLAAAARLATQQAGVRRSFDWKDMLVVGVARPRYDLAETRVVERGAHRAVVEVRGAHGERETVEVVLEGETWKLELPEPPPEQPASAGAPAGPASAGAASAPAP